MTGKGGNFAPEPSSGWIVLLVAAIVLVALVLTRSNLP